MGKFLYLSWSLKSVLIIAYIDLKRFKVNQDNFVNFTIFYVVKSMFQWPFLITYIFSVSLKFGASYSTGHWGEFRIKNAILFS